MSFWERAWSWWEGLFEPSAPRSARVATAPRTSSATPLVEPVAPVQARQGRPWRSGCNARGEDSEELRRILLDELTRIELGCTGFAERRFLSRLQATIALQDLGLPPFPVTVLQLKRLLARGAEVPAARLARVVEGDAALVRAVLQQARGAAWSQAPDSLKSAIVRIGNDALWRIAMRVALDEAVFRVPAYHEEIEAVRVHCFAVAETAAWMLGDAEERGTGWLAGLVHDMGKLVVYREAAAVRAQVDEELVQRVLDLAHAPVGRLMAEAWGLGELEAQAIGFHHPGQGVGDEARRLGRYLLCADMAAHVALAQQAREGDTGREDLVAASRGLGFDPEQAIRVADRTLMRFRRLKAA